MFHCFFWQNEYPQPLPLNFKGDLGTEISRGDTEIPSWAEVSLLDRASKKGKGQLPVLIGAIYRGSKQHVALKAGGNDEVQLKVAQQGVVTTGEKYVVAHSAHVSVRFVAVTWHDLSPITPRTAGDDDSDKVNYRQPRNRNEEPNGSGDTD